MQRVELVAGFRRTLSLNSILCGDLHSGKSSFRLAGAVPCLVRGGILRTCPSSVSGRGDLIQKKMYSLRGVFGTGLKGDKNTAESHREPTPVIDQ